MKFSSRIFSITISFLGLIYFLFHTNCLHGKRKFQTGDSTKGKILTNKNGDWYIEDDLCKPRDDFVRAQLKMENSVDIFVYPTTIDKWVSGRIIREGKWEEDHIKKIYRILKSDPSLIFLDIGANVGAFSLTMAELGNQVIAVDALSDNVGRLCASMTINNLQDKMSIIHNALSYIHEKVSLGKFHLNVGGTFVKQMGVSDNSDVIVIDAIILDDLLDLYDFKGGVVIKMDVESFEANVLRGARNFFQNVNVVCVLMEFMAHRGKDSGQFIVEFLQTFGLEPMVSNSNQTTWPMDVMFTKPNTRLVHR